MPADSEIARSAAAHLISCHVEAIESLSQFPNPRRQLFCSLFQSIMKLFACFCQVATGERVLQWRDGNCFTCRTADGIDSRRAESDGRLDNDQVHPACRNRIDALASAATDCPAASQEKGNIAAQLARQLCQTLATPAEAPCLTGRQQGCCRIAGSAPQPGGGGDSLHQPNARAG